MTRRLPDLSNLATGNFAALHGSLPSSTAERNPNTLLAAQLLDTLSQSPAESSSAPGPLTQALAGNSQANLSQAFASLSSTQQEKIRSSLGESSLRELFSLSRETDPELFSEALYNFGVRLEQRDKAEAAGLVYGYLSTLNSELRTPNSELSISHFAIRNPQSAIVYQAQSRLNALNGRGEFGLRLEALGRRFARDTMNPFMLASMGGAQLVSNVGRLGFASLLSRGALFRSPTLIRAIASTGAFALEIPTFVGIHRGLNELVGNRQLWTTEALLHELEGTALTLGALKLSGAASTAAFNRIHGITPLGQATRLVGFSAISQRLLPQVAMLGGIYLGHKAETYFTLRPETDAATTLADSLAMLFQFNIAGRLMQDTFGPRFESLNRNLHLRAEQLADRHAEASSPSTHWWEKIFGRQEIRIPTGPNGETLPGHIQLMSAEGGGEGPGDASSGSGAGPSARPSSHPPKQEPLWARGIRAALGLGEKINLNPWFNPDRPMEPLPTQSPADPVRSVHEGILRGQALGQDRRTLAFLRWGAHQLRETTETQTQFLQLMQRVFEFQSRSGQARDPILQGIPDLDFRHVNGLGKTYAEALAQIDPHADRYWAEHQLVTERTQGLKTREDYLRFSGESMIEMGFEPEAVQAIARNAHAFTEAEINRLLDHPLLRLSNGSGGELPEVTALREAYKRFNREMEELAPRLQEVKARVRPIRKQMALTRDAKIRRDFEKQIREISGPVNISYKKSESRLNKAMEKFLADPLRARVFTIENARRASLVRGLQDAPRNFLVNRVRSQIDTLPESVRPLAEAYLKAVEEMEIVEGRSPLSRFFFGAASLLGLDPHAPMGVRGRYERALLRLIEQAPAKLWDHSPIRSHDLQGALEAQSQYYRERHRLTQTLREAFARIEPVNDAFWTQYDREAIELYASDLQLQLHQVQELIERVRLKLGEGIFQQRYFDYGRKLTETEEVVREFTDPITRGQNSRDMNRTLQAALERIGELRHFTREALRREIPSLAEFQAVSALMLPVTQKLDASWTTRPWETITSLLPSLWQTAKKATRLISSVGQRESVAVADRLFLDWGNAQTTSSDWIARFFRFPTSRFIVDPHVDYLVESDPMVVAGNHNAWWDFLRGKTPAVRAAQLQGRGTARDAVRIAAKEGLGKMIGPVVERAIELLTESVADSLPEYDGSVTNLARAMAFGDVPSTRLGPRTSAVYDELTMSVASLVHPYHFDPFPAISSILEPPQGGRSFNIADRALALTGRSQNLLLTSTLNGYRLWPKPDSPYTMRRGSTTTTTQFLPARVLADATSSSKTGGTRANWLRTFWLTQATTPEYEQAVPSIDRMFAPFETPTDLSIEASLERMFGGALDVYPSAERIRSLETERQQVLSQMDAEENLAGKGRLHNRLDRLERVLDLQTRQLLKNRMTMMDQELQPELQRTAGTPEYKGLRRLQRILRSRMKLLDQVERKLAHHEPLTLTERRFFEQASAAIAGRSNVSGRDHSLEQLDYYLNVRGIGVNLRQRLLQVQGEYYRFVESWNERRKDEANPEHRQIHVSEAEGYQDIWNDYRIAVETVLNLYGITPSRWEGEIFPDITFRREGQDLILEPKDWQASAEFSRSTLWRFFLDDTTGIVRLAKAAKDFDPTQDLFLTIHRGWGHRTLRRTQTRLRIENTRNLIPVANLPSIIAPTHDSGAEFPIIAAIMHDYGFRAFYMADRKFFDPFWGERTFKILGREFTIPFPQGPAYGLIRALLGPMEQYGQFSIDRSDGRGALQAMKDSGKLIAETGRSMVIFPGSTRNPVRYNERGERYEGPIYGAKPGIALTWEGSRGPLIPIGMVNGAVIFPKQAGDAFIRGGAAIGREYRMRFGEPLFYDRIVPGNPHPPGSKLREALIPELNRQFSELTGRKIAPPAESKAKKKKGK